MSLIWKENVSYLHFALLGPDCLELTILKIAGKISLVIKELVFLFWKIVNFFVFSEITWK